MRATSGVWALPEAFCNTKAKLAIKQSSIKVKCYETYYKRSNNGCKAHRRNDKYIYSSNRYMFHCRWTILAFLDFFRFVIVASSYNVCAVRKIQAVSYYLDYFMRYICYYLVYCWRINRKCVFNKCLCSSGDYFLNTGCCV